MGKVTVTLRSRGRGPEHALTFPDFPAPTDVVTVQLNDFEQSATPLPTPAACVRHRRFVVRIRQPHHGRIVRVAAYVNGKRIKRVRRHRIRRISLRWPRGKTSLRVVIVSWTAHGRRTVLVRRFHIAEAGALT